ncbi:MAG TPA: protein phosphatase 2C domain-containing protein [Bryobacteraceae bacterium]|nr:protein phosphatase 2C domain-containing protein [Bryobacteraceae bacterium]
MRPATRMLSFHGITDPGCVRADNEDRFLADGELDLFIVADGMGGHRHGALAAEVAITTVRYYIESSRGRTDVTWPFGYDFTQSLNANRLATAIRLANRQVWRRAEDGPEYAGMGTTIAGLLVEGTQCAVANVGDSRVYLLRNGHLTQLTTDDTWLNAVLQTNRVPAAQLENHPMRNVLTQAAGSQGDVEVHTSEVALESGDLFLLSTDGLHGVVGEEALREMLMRGGDPEARVGALVEAARYAGAPDNVAGVVVCYLQG